MPVTSFASRTFPVRWSTSPTPPTMSIPHNCIGPGRSKRRYELRGASWALPARPMPDRDPVDRPLRRHNQVRRWRTQQFQPDPSRPPPRMPTAHLRDRHLDRGRHLMRARLRPVRPVHQPAQLVGQIPAHPPVHRGPMHTGLAVDLGDLRTRQNRSSRIQPLFDDRQHNQSQSRPPRSTGRPTETPGPRVPNQPRVAHQLAEDCRTSPDGGQLQDSYRTGCLGSGDG